MDTCAGTFSTLKACMSLEKHRRFVGTDLDENCILTCQDSIIECYAEQVLNQNSDIITKDVEIRQACEMVSLEIKRRQVKRRADAWETPPGLVPIQNFPPHIVQYLCQYYQDFTLYNGYRHLSMNKWGLLWIQRMNSADTNALLSYEAMMLSLQVKKSLIKHPKAGMGVFTTKPRAKGDVIGYYYGALVYGDLGTNRRLLKRYGTGILSCTSEDFDIWANQLAHPFTDNKNNQYDGYIIPAPFCVTRYINDEQYTDGDKEKHLLTKKSSENSSEKAFNRRRRNVRFVEDTGARSNRCYEKYSSLAVVAMRDIAEGEELYVHYSNDYII